MKNVVDMRITGEFYLTYTHTLLIQEKLKTSYTVQYEGIV